MVRLEDIAKESGVSIGTVQRALYNKGRIAEATKQRVLETAERLGYQPNMVAKGLAARKKSITLGFLYVDDDFSPLQRTIADNAREYAATLESYGVTTVFIPLRGLLPEPEIREKQMLDILQRHPFDGIAALGPVAAEFTAVQKKYKLDMIPTVSYNVDGESTEDGSLCYIGCDFKQSGKLAAGLTGFALNGRGRACIISVDYPDLPSTKKRIAGFKEELAEKYPGITITGTLMFSPDQDSKGNGSFSAIGKRFLEEQGEIDIIYYLYAGSDELCRSMEEIGRMHHARIITSDLVTDYQKTLLNSERFSAAVMQDAREQGRKTLKVLFDYAAYGIVPEEKHIQTGFSVMIPQNAMDV